MPYLDFSHVPPTPVPTLLHAREIGREAGLRFVYLGNVDVPGGEDTRCPECDNLAIMRRGFSARTVGVGPGGACARCGRDLAIRL